MNDFNIPAGLTEKTNRPGSVKCDDCGRWADLGERILHSGRCDTGDLQATRPATTATRRRTLAQAAREGTAYGEGHDVDDMVDAVRCGDISVSTAMNQDM